MKPRNDLGKNPLIGKPSIILTVLALLLSVFAITWTRVVIIQQGYRYSAQADRQRVLIEQNKKLRIKLAELRAPARLQKIATEDLHMAAPKQKQIVIVARDVYGNIQR